MGAVPTGQRPFCFAVSIRRINTTLVVRKPTVKSIISGEKRMNTNRKTPRKVVRVVSASIYRRLGSKLNREKKQSKALRRMRPEREDE